MATTYRIHHSHGLTEGAHESYDEACDAVRAVYGEDCEIGHDGDISEGGERTLCWRDEESSRDDDGLRACCSIRASHDL